jgi:hypothetical protein
VSYLILRSSWRGWVLAGAMLSIVDWSPGQQVKNRLQVRLGGVLEI